jgi:hypothetical protein
MLGTRAWIAWEHAEGNDMGLIRVHSSDEEKIAEALDRLRPLGVELLTSETEEPEELILFYMSRMNNKLDNLGQLRHLVKIEKHLLEIKQAQRDQGQLAKRALAQDDAHGLVMIAMYEKLKDVYAHDPKLDRVTVSNLCLDDLYAVFQNTLTFK